MKEITPEEKNRLEKEYVSKLQELAQEIGLKLSPKNIITIITPAEYKLIEYIRTLKFGDITIKIHDGSPSLGERIIERIKFDDDKQ